MIKLSLSCYFSTHLSSPLSPLFSLLPLRRTALLVLGRHTLPYRRVRLHVLNDLTRRRIQRSVPEKVKMMFSVGYGVSCQCETV